MTRIANKADHQSPTREYRSELRAAQAEATRARILDATVRVMADGVASVSIPAVAREAGVSVPTVYRHFKTKRDLLNALHPHLMQRVGIHHLPIPRSLDELRDLVRTLYGLVDSLSDMERAAMASPASEEVRHLNMPDRLASIRQFVSTVAPDVREVDRNRVARLMAVLTTSSAMRMWRDHFGSSADEAANDLDWTLRAFIASASPRRVRR